MITASSGECSAACTVTVKPVPVAVEKVTPTVTQKITFKNSKTTITGQSDIGVNPDLYYTEIKHGVLYVQTSKLGSRNLLATTSGATNKVLTSYNEDGTFSYTFKPLNSTMSYAYRSYVYYQKPDGSRIYVYSPIIKGTGRNFMVD